MSYYTLHYRLKDSTTSKRLSKLTSNVNDVWNYCKDTTNRAYNRDFKYLSAFDLHKLTSGCSKELNLNSTTIQAICEEYSSRREILFKNRKLGKTKKVQLKWRGKKSLGWIPFKGSSIKYLDGNFVYNKHSYKFFDSKYKFIDLTTVDIKFGSFNQDSRGRWYINVVIKVDDIHTCLNLNNSVGIDLGLKEVITTSDGECYENLKFYRNQQDRLGSAQRAKHSKHVKSIHNKIKNRRRDYLNKITTKILKDYDFIVVGNLHLSASKATLDASFYTIKQLLLSKAIRLGKTVVLVNEAWTTQRCSCCKQLHGPKGLSGLSIREWSCSSCGAKHHRDINAATNILALGHESL